MYYHTKANVHRGVHTLSQEATDLQEATRERVRAFINAKHSQEIIFTRGTTEAINLVASSFGDLMENGDEVILTVMEHHANIVPWQLLGRRKRVILRVVPINSTGELDMVSYRSLFNDRTKLVSVCHVSNVLGTVNPVKEMIAEAHRNGVPVLIDGAQAISHIPVDVQDLDAEANKENMISEMLKVKSGSVTYAVRDTVIDDKEIKENDIMGIGDAGIVSVGTDLFKTTIDMISNLVDDDSEIISIYYGQDVTEEDAQSVADKIEQLYPDVEVDVNYGGQPIYYYVLSVE